MKDGAAYMAYRVRILPHQLAAARARMRQLESEARRYGFHDLLEPAGAESDPSLVPAPPLGRDGAAAPLSAAAPLVPAQEGR